MLKRTTGRLLLTLLVITGLAGTLKNSSLSQKERKQAINLMKNSKADIVNSVSGLSEKQLSYKPSPGELSIRELVETMAALEKKCNREIKTALEQPSNSENRLKIALTDNQLLASNNYPLSLATELEEAKKTADLSETLKKFAAMRNSEIKYIRTSTEDLRNRVVATPAGWIDCYQYYLLLADRSSDVAEKIRQIRSLPSFPQK